MKFKPIIARQRMMQNFDKEKITITKAGKTYNVYDAIQESRDSTEIYPTLEKYGSIKRMELDTQGVYGDFTNFKELRDLKEQQMMAEQMFYKLPFDVRKEFNNNISTFLKEGESYLNKIMTPATEKTVEVKENENG